jgi:hypothetical protein
LTPSPNAFGVRKVEGRTIPLGRTAVLQSAHERNDMQLQQYLAE